MSTGGHALAVALATTWKGQSRKRTERPESALWPSLPSQFQSERKEVIIRPSSSPEQTPFYLTQELRESPQSFKYKVPGNARPQRRCGNFIF